MAVEIASERLAQMPRHKRMMWAYVAVSVLFGVTALALGATIFAGLSFFGAVLGVVVGLPLLTRYSQPRWERARRLNAEVAAHSDAPE